MLDSQKYRMKHYLHFDHRIQIQHVESYITDSKRIAVHSFLPFIHYTITSEKYTGINNPELNNRPATSKERNIMYAGHLDNYIYKYYTEEILNKKYNKWCDDNGVDECSIAYRNNKHGQSNIDFAATIIND
ncbi:hypothetical protein [Lysinibacillus boronitolerans]|uniref:hypothetical protein n=1 Tax=Lysinibacillus TaxID=400634 RepID=UPI00289CC628|nr:hypothetical protein [Lysinibacillus boronitolerans]